MNTPISNPNAPGDRQALYNAALRAQRRGTQSNSLINAQIVREALAQAKNINSFTNLLNKQKIEIEFTKRGQNDEIYGYKLRQQGAGEWIKASTLAKDLSWPKIAHRFKNDVELHAAIQTAQTPKPKVPEMLKPLLPAPFGTRDMRPYAAHQTEETTATSKFSNQVASFSISSSSKTLHLLAELMTKVSTFLVSKLVAFLRRLMSAFGFGLRECKFQTVQHNDPKALLLNYEPFQLCMTASQAAEQKCADELHKVARAIETNDPSLLPVVEGEEAAIARAELVAAMIEPESLTGVTTATESDSNFSFKGDDLLSSTSSAITPITDSLDDLKAALANHAITAHELEIAKIKDGPIHFTTVAQRQAELKIVREDLQVAQDKWDEFCAEHSLTWRIPSAEKTRLRQNIENNLEAAKRAIEAVAAAEAEDARIKKLYATLPAAIVPVAVSRAEAHARLDIKTALESIQSEAFKLITVLKNDPVQAAKAVKIEVEVKESFKNFLESGLITADNFSGLKTRIDNLRVLERQHQAAKEAADFVQDDSQVSHHKPIIDEQKIK